MRADELTGCVRSLTVTVLVPKASRRNLRRVPSHRTAVCVLAPWYPPPPLRLRLRTLARRLTPQARAKRPRLARSLAVDELTADERARLGPALYEIFCASYGDLDLETVTEEIVFRPGGRLYIYADADGALVGFCTASYETFTLDGTTHAVWNGGAYFLRRVRGGAAALAAALRGPLAYRLTHPTHAVSLMYESLHPASYRLSVRTFPKVYPNRNEPTPPAMQRLLEAVIARRGLSRSGAHPLVVRYPDPASHKDPERVALSMTLCNDPDVGFYLSQNPRYDRGDILCCLVPFTLGSLSQGLLRSLRGA